MKFIIVGAGAVGVSLSQRLAANQHDIVLIEKNETVAERIPLVLDLQVVHGNGCSADSLSRAGIDSADYLVAVTDSDEVNMAAAMVSRMMNPAAKRIVRIRNLDLTHPSINRDKLKETFDLIINPEQAGADHLFDLYKIPGAQEVIEFAEGRLRLLGVQVAERSNLDKKKVSALEDFHERSPFLLVAIVRDNKIIVPKGTDRVRAGDLIYSLSTPDKTDFILELAGQKRRKPTGAIIWGGSMIGKFLARQIAATGANVKLIVTDEREAALSMEELDNILVLQGHGTDQELLVEENVQDIDAFVAVSPYEEENILAALLAKKLGARTSMALIDKVTYRQLVLAIGVDIAVSSHVAAASQIFRHIHSESVISEFSLRQREGSFIEILIDRDSPVCGRELHDLKLPAGILVAAIIRQDKVIIPHGPDKLLENDLAIIFVLQSSIRKLQQFLDIKLEIVG